MALANPVVRPPVLGRKTSTTPPGTPPPTGDPVQSAARSRQRARFMEEQRRNADARRLSLAGGSQDPDPTLGYQGKPSAGLGGREISGGGPIGEGSGRVRSAERGGLMEGWRNPITGEVVGAGGVIVPEPEPDPAPDPSTGQQNVNRHPNRGNSRNAPGQVSQEAAQALYNDSTIPHEFKGQLMELARSGNAQSFAQALFGSGIPHETKLRLMELFGFGGGQPAAGGPIPQPQGAPQPAPQNVAPVVPPNPQGSQYYGAFS